MQNGDTVITAINIWKKYGVTLNHGSGNYLNWYSLDKCVSDHGKCPDGFFQNEGEHCVPKHDHGCPSGHHSIDDDESGQCIKNKKGCPDGMEFRPNGKSCTYKQEEQPEQPIPLVDLSKEPVDPVIPLVDINQDPTTTTTDTTTPPTTTIDQPTNTDQSTKPRH